MHEQPTSDKRAPCAKPPTTALAAGLLIGAALAGALPPAAHAQQAAGAAPRSGAEVLRFDIPALPLEQALGLFGRQAGKQVLFNAGDVAGRRSQAVGGALTPRDALTRLLAGSGLVISSEQAGGFAVRHEPAAAGQGQVLAAVNVRAEGLGGASDDAAVATQSYGANKTETPILETPQSVSVVTREQMDEMGAQSVEQAVGYLAGVDIGTYGTDSRVDEIWVRGFRTGSFANNLYVDGLRPPGSSSGGAALSTRFDSYGLERVEVLRGPSSTLYGQVAPGGLVNIRSKRPPQDRQRQIGVQTDSEGLARVNMDIGGPIDEEKTWLYRLVGSASHTGTQVDHVELNRIFFNPSLTWQPTTRTSITFLGNYQQDRGGSTYQFLPATGTYLPSPYGKVPSSRFLGEPGFNRYDRNQTAIGYSLEQFIGESAKLRQNVRYIEVDMNTDGASRRTVAADGRTLTGSANSYENHSKGISVDTNLLYTLETGPATHMLLGGFDFHKTDIELASASGTVGPLDLFDPVYGSPVTMGPLTPNSENGRVQRGIYLQDQIFWNNWTVTAGLRHDWAKTRSISLTNHTRSDEAAEATTGRIGVNYLFANGVAPYASYSTSFQPSSGEDYYGKPFDPVTGEQYEAGIKYQPPGSRSLITAAVYEITQSNILTTDPDPTHICNGGSCRVQTGEGRVRGFELEGTYELTRALSITGAYTYMDAKVTQSNSSDLGKWLPRVPRELISLRFNYRLSPGMSFGMGARYTGFFYGDSANTWKNDSRTMVDAALRFNLAELDARLRGMRMSINVSNLFDEEYVSCNGAAACFYGPRRLVSASLTYNW